MNLIDVRILGLLVCFGSCLLSPAAARAADAPDPVTCTGYGETRYYLDTQAWWEPQPTTGGTGHIHVGTCFPVWGTLTGDTLVLDLRLQMFNLPREAQWGALGIRDANKEAVVLEQRELNLTCNLTLCDEKTSPAFLQRFVIDLRQFAYDGWKMIAIDAQVHEPGGGTMFLSTRYPVYVQQGRTVLKGNSAYVSGLGWHTNRGYFSAGISQASFPFSPISGRWQLRMRYRNSENNAHTAFVSVDPDFHAAPHDQGMPVYGPGAPGGAVSVTTDTSRLAPGPHRLFIRCDEVPSTRTPVGIARGVLVVGFTKQ